MSSTQAGARLAFVDALRGWAVLGVIWGHCLLFLPIPSPSVERFLLLIGPGVELFFLASAFTLCRSAAARQTERRAVGNFYLRRWFRIAPMYCLGAALYLALWGRGDAPLFTPGGPHVSWQEIISTLTFTNGWGRYWQNRVVPGGWSIVVEVYFYVCFPLLFRAVRSLNGAGLLLLLSYVIGVSLSCGLVYATQDRADADIWGVFAGRWLPAEMPVFGLGFVLYHWLRERDPDAARSVPVTGRLLLATAAVCWVISAFTSSPVMPSYLIGSIACFCFAAALAIHPQSWFAARPFQRLGKVSYSAYLIHFAFLLPLRALGFVPLARQSPYVALVAYAAAVLAVTTVVSTLTYRLVELPCIAAGRWLIRRWEVPAPRVTAPPISQTW